VSFEPDIVSVQLDGKQLRLEPGQAVIPHGPDRELTVAEAHERVPVGDPRRAKRLGRVDPGAQAATIGQRREAL